MNRSWSYLICTMLICAVSPNAASADTAPKHEPAPVAIDVDSEIEKAKAAIGSFAAALQTELKLAMKEGGPVNAIGVCHTKALPITQAIAIEQGLKLSRVSLRNRNPANAPENWQIAVLQSFENRKDTGEDPAALSWHEIANVDGRQQFRFMKAIPTAPLCLQCHGSTITPDVEARLNELYPQDKAIGFETGDIRGAFVVTRQL
ncbi:DUF3365 domain-containing protein [Pseudomonadota bacterium]